MGSTQLNRAYVGEHTAFLASCPFRSSTVDTDHLEAAIHILDPENTPEGRKRYAAHALGAEGQSTRFVLGVLRAATGPLTSRQIAQAWAKARGLDGSDATLVILTKRIGATLRALQAKGTVRQDGHRGGLIGWRIATPAPVPI